MQQPADSDLFKLGRPARVLVADDDAQNRELIQEVCRSEGFEAEGLAKGDEVIEAVHRGIFDLLLLDATMPGMDGLEVCRVLKGDPMTAELPVIIVTATLDEGVHDRAAELGVFDIIAKPFRVFDLVQRMRRALRPRSRAGDPPTAPRIRLRRRRVDVLSALPAPRTLRARLQREIEACTKAARPVTFAVVRLENEAELSVTVGRTLTDALLGGVVVRLLEAFQDGIVRGDLDELGVVLAEDQLPVLAAIIADTPACAAGLGVPASVEVKMRWGATILEARQADPDGLLAGARRAVELAQQVGEASHVDRSGPDRSAPVSGARTRPSV